MPDMKLESESDRRVNVNFTGSALESLHFAAFSEHNLLHFADATASPIRNGHVNRGVNHRKEDSKLQQILPLHIVQSRYKRSVHRAQ